MSMILDGSNGVTFNDSSLQGAAASPYVLKNRIINGDMRIDQRNNGAAVTVNTGSVSPYTVDRFYCNGVTSAGVFTAQQSTTAPAGFSNSLKFTVTTADSSVGLTRRYEFAQVIEGYNTADLSFGTANAKTFTLSFWVRSSVTGTFGGAFANENANRSYVFSYTISAADTWEFKTITVAGDTTGTWTGATNGYGLRIYWSLGEGTSNETTAGVWNSGFYLAPTGSVNLISTLNATLYITGVQLEIGTSATPFERRLYNQELANCQRYYYKIKPSASGGLITSSAFAYTTTLAGGINQFPVTMRIAPTALEQTGTAGDYAVRLVNTPVTCSSVPVFTIATPYHSLTDFTVASGLTAGTAGFCRDQTGNGYLAWSAEL